MIMTIKKVLGAIFRLISVKWTWFWIVNMDISIPNTSGLSSCLQSRKLCEFMTLIHTSMRLLFFSIYECANDGVKVMLVLSGCD